MIKSPFLIVKSSFLMVKFGRSLDEVGPTVLRQAALPGYGYGGYPEGGSNGYAPQRTAGQLFFFGVLKRTCKVMA